jgi:hypothetical protein
VLSFISRAFGFRSALQFYCFIEHVVSHKEIHIIMRKRMKIIKGGEIESIWLEKGPPPREIELLLQHAVSWLMGMIGLAYRK